MTSPADQVLSPGRREILQTEDQSNGSNAPANPSSSCILGLGTANPDNCYLQEDRNHRSCQKMTSPADQVLSPGRREILQTEDQSNGSNAPANPSSSCILGLGTANPDNCYLQEDFGTECLKLFGYHEMPLAKTSVERICNSLGIVQKHLAFSPEIYQRHPTLTVYNDPNLGERFDIYEPEAMNICKLAAERALADWGGDRADITHLISYSTTMILSPSLDLRLVKCLNLQANVKHYSVSLLGCHGGVNGIRTAAEIAQADPRSRILVVFVEINSAAAQVPNPENPLLDLSPMVMNMIFGDGAGAVVIGKSPTREENTIFEVNRAHTYLVPETADTLVEKLLPSGLHATCEKNCPALIGQNIGGFVNELLRDTKLTYDNVNWAMSPSPKPYLDAIEKDCKLKAEQLQVSRHILRNYGNMGASSILFVLDKFCNDKKLDKTIHPWTFAWAFGPGLTMEGLLLKHSS